MISGVVLVGTLDNDVGSVDVVRGSAVVALVGDKWRGNLVDSLVFFFVCSFRRFEWVAIFWVSFLEVSSSSSSSIVFLSSDSLSSRSMSDVASPIMIGTSGRIM